MNIALSNFSLSLVAGLFVGAAAGYLGSLMVLRRMALVGDALSHVALPGIAFALLLNINPFLGAFLFLFLAAWGIWFLEEKTAVSPEALVGIFFTLSLAGGVLLVPEHELLEALFGDISQVSLWDTVFAVFLSLLVFFLTSRIHKSSLLAIISRDLAESLKLSVRRSNLIFFLLVALIVALGVKVVGTLLMGALVIIPGVCAKNMFQSLQRFTLTSMCIGALAAGSGIIAAHITSLPPGPLVVLAGGFLFLCSLLLKFFR